MDCTCGRPIEFMEYSCRIGLAPMIKVGCPDCEIMFFLLVQDVVVDDLPRMNQFDWMRMMKRGRYSSKGNCVKEEVNEAQLVLMK